MIITIARQKISEKHFPPESGSLRFPKGNFVNKSVNEMKISSSNQLTKLPLSKMWLSVLVEKAEPQSLLNNEASFFER